MAKLPTSGCKPLTPPPQSFPPSPSLKPVADQRRRMCKVRAAKSGAGFFLTPIPRRCQTCGGNGAIECPGCKGTGKNKKNGNIFERWKCFECQGFGLKSCPGCGQGGLTPEQRGDR